MKDINAFSSSDSALPPRSDGTVIELFEECLELAALRARRRLDEYRYLQTLQRKSDGQSPSPPLDVPASSGIPEMSSKDADEQRASR